MGLNYSALKASSASQLNNLGGLISGMSLQARIQEAMDAAGKSPADLARATKKTAGAVSQWLDGTIKTIKTDTAASLQAATGYNAMWLATGKGPKKEANIVELEETFPGVPLISWVQAGKWSKIAGAFRPEEAEENIPCPVRHGEGTFALRVRGQSMFAPGSTPSFQEGDRVFVDPTRDAMHKSLVIARLDDEDEATFKQLLIEGDQKFLSALNPSWPNRIIPINGNCSIVGVVIGKLEMFV